MAKEGKEKKTKGFPVAEPATAVDKQSYGAKPPEKAKGKAPTALLPSDLEKRFRGLRKSVRALEAEADRLRQPATTCGAAAEVTLAYRHLQQARHFLGEALLRGGFAEPLPD